MYMMLMLAKRGAELNALVTENQWNKRMSTIPVDLYGKTVLVVGFGRIGTRSAKRCQAMEMNVLVYDPYKPAAEIKAAGCEPVANLDEGLAKADFVTIHCPKTPETVGMFNAARLARMKPTAYLVNTARGPVVDTAALARALHAGEIAGAALDVFENEPQIHPDLSKLENVVLSPHLGSATREARTAMADLAVSNVLAVLGGQPPLTPIN